MRIAYFTAGSTGAGHLVRGIAIARGLARRGFAHELQMFGPRLPFAAAERADYRAVPIDAAELRDERRAPESELARALVAYAPQLLLVDCYWAPLRHILPLRGCEAWLLARWLPDDWFAGPPEAPFEPRQYAQRIAIEPVRVPRATDLLPPIVVCNPDEARPPGSLRARLGVADGQRLRVAAHAGVPGEIERLQSDTSITLSLFDPRAPFPLAEWLGDADEIACAPGYNSYWEARWMGTLGRTHFVPLDRQRPEHEWRLRAGPSVEMRANGADVLARLIAGRRS